MSFKFINIMYKFSLLLLILVIGIILCFSSLQGGNCEQVAHLSPVQYQYNVSWNCLYKYFSGCIGV